MNPTTELLKDLSLILGGMLGVVFVVGGCCVYFFSRKNKESIPEIWEYSNEQGVKYLKPKGGKNV